jgi:hypothetical protein
MRHDRDAEKARADKYAEALRLIYGLINEELSGEPMSWHEQSNLLQRIYKSSKSARKEET